MNVKTSIVLNTVHFAVEVIENERGINIDVFHRDGEHIASYPFSNEDVMDSD